MAQPSNAPDKTEEIMEALNTEQKQAITELWQKHFNGSMVSITPSCFTNESEGWNWCAFYIAGSKDEVFNGIIQNDMIHVSFTITLKNGIYTLENKANSYLIAPQVNKYMAYESIRIPFRKTKGDFNKVYAALERFIIKLSDSLLDSYNKGILSHSNDNIDYYGNNVGHIHMVEKHLAALQH